MGKLSSFKTSKRALGLGMALIAAVVLVPAMASFQSINAIVNTHYVVIKSPIEGALDGFTKMPGQPIGQGEELLRINNSRFKESAIHAWACSSTCKICSNCKRIYKAGSLSTAPTNFCDSRNNWRKRKPRGKPRKV